MPGETDAFRSAAEEYCAWAEGRPSSEWEEAQTAVRHLAAVLHYVMGLPAGASVDTQIRPLTDTAKPAIRR